MFVPIEDLNLLNVDVVEYALLIMVELYVAVFCATPVAGLAAPPDESVIAVCADAVGWETGVTP